MKAGVWLFLALVILSPSTVRAFSEMSFTVDLSADLRLGWKFVDGTQVIFQVEHSLPGWAGIGIASSMADGDVVLFEVPDGKVAVRDCHFGGHRPPTSDEPQDWVVLDSSTNPSGFKVEIKRAVKTGDPFDRDIMPETLPIVFAYGNKPTVAFHGGPGSNFQITSIDFAKGTKKDSKWTFGDGTYMKHQHTQLLLWTIGIDTLIPVGRHLRKYSRFFDAHSWPMLVILIVSVLLRNPEQKKGDSLRDKHGLISYFLLALSGLIALNGLFLRAIIEFEIVPFGTKIITYIRRLHSLGGVTIWIVSRIMVFIGTAMHKRLYGPLLEYLVIYETIIFILIMTGLEYLRWGQFNYRRVKDPSSDDTVSRPALSTKTLEMLDDVKDGMSISKLKAKYPGKTVFIYHNKVFDVTGYIHPGGQSIFKECAWREVSRFLHGGVGLEFFNGRKWVHSKQAFDKLNSHIIGNLIEGGPEGSEIVLRNQDGHPYIATLRDEWIMIGRKKISEHIGLLHFKCQNTRVKLACTGTAWLGRHFTISDGAKSRPYTNCTSLAEEAATYRKAMLEFFERLVAKNPFAGEAPVLPEFIEYLPFCVKQYETPGSLSKKLVSEDQQIPYSIEGPIGRGFEIPRDFSGHALLIVGGNGILPFLDLLELLLKKAVFEACQKEGLDPSFIQPRQDYSRIFPGAKFTLLGAFRSADEVLGLDILAGLMGLSQRFKLNLFDSLIRVEDLGNQYNMKTTKSVFTSTLLSEYIGKHSEELVLLCGPPSMQSAIFGELTTQLKIAKDSIIFV